MPERRRRRTSASSGKTGGKILNHNRHAQTMFATYSFKNVFHGYTLSKSFVIFQDDAAVLSEMTICLSENYRCLSVHV